MPTATEEIARDDTQQRLALILSGLLHPAALPSWAFGEILFGKLMPLGVAPEARVWLWAVMCFVTLVLPAALITAARYLGIVSDWQLRPKADRMFALWLTSSLYIGAAWGMMGALPTALFRLLAGLAGLSLLKTVINLFYRMSGHTLGMAAFTGYWLAFAYLTGDAAFLLPLVACVLGTGAVIWARLTLGAHTVGEILWGLGVGLLAGAGVGVWSEMF